MRNFTRSHLLAGIAFIIVIISILGVIAYNNWIGITVNLQTNNPRDQIGPYEIITLTFSQAVRPADVEKQLQIQPAIDAKLTWQTDRTLQITPVKAYLGTLNIHLPPGKFGVNGDAMRVDASWKLTVRKPAIVYIHYAEPKDELMSIPAEGGSVRQLTSSGGKVLGFDVAPSGDAIVYSVINNQNGADLWLMDRNGQNSRLLVGCKTDSCHAAKWSPDGKTIAYNRAQPGATEEDPRVYLWIITAETAENRPAFFDTKLTGAGASWSPDGNWLASYDSTVAKIRAVQLITHKEILLPSNTDQLGSWAPDSNTLIYPDFTTDGQGTILENSLFMVDFKTSQTRTVQTVGSNDNDYRYGNPLWSPAGDLIALSMRDLRHQIPQLWVVRADKPDESIMNAASGYSYDSYQWDMWGKALLIQQTSLTRAYLYEVAIWDAAQGYRVVGKDVLNPRWLP